jgi:phosphatidylglycerol---prolipoprotein diacylglyceryl transferase
MIRTYHPGGSVGSFAAIQFPNIDPVFFALGPVQFRWYGLMYLIGLSAAYLLIKRKAARKDLPISPDQVYDMVIFAALGVFLGGRLGYTLFYNFPYYSEHPLKIIAVWEGGMSFHGGLLGTIVALLWFSKRTGIPTYTVADLAAAVTPIGLGFGRLGNFINGELYGRATDVDWCMVFPGAGPACRHGLLEFSDRLWPLPVVRGIVSRARPAHWLYVQSDHHGTDSFCSHGRNRNSHADVGILETQS